MARLNNNKLQTQRNFLSIWHNDPKYISQTLREDQLIREYIIGTMKAKEWKVSEIIIKRKVKLIHIAFQIQYKKIKERKRWTKNRLKNRIKYQEKLKRKKSFNKNKTKKIYLKKRLLFFQLFLMIVELRKMYPQNQITFYVQRVQPLQFNTNLINEWIISNFNKKKSYKRLINQIIYKFKRGVQKTNPKFQSLHITWKGLTRDNRKNLVSWITANLIYLFNTYQSFYNSELKNIRSDNTRFRELPRSGNTLDGISGGGNIAPRGNTSGGAVSRVDMLELKSQSTLSGSCFINKNIQFGNNKRKKNPSFNKLWFRYLNSKKRKSHFSPKKNQINTNQYKKRYFKR